MELGAHVSAVGGVAKLAQRAADLGGSAAQFFLGSPRTWALRPADLPDRVTVAEIKRATGVTRLVVHASYLINIGSPDDEIYSKSVTLLLQTMEAAGAIGVDGVVLHPGSHRGAGLDAVLGRWGSAVGEALERCNEPTEIWLENTAGAGGTIGETMAELALLREQVGARDRVGFCIDTQHLFAAGCNLSDEASRIAMVAEISNVLGGVACVHLNDSKTPCGSHRDRHENLDLGAIGGGHLGAFCSASIFDDAVVILEVPGEGDGPRETDVSLARAYLEQAGATVAASSRREI
ncbi:MAG: deoxyribonuclease IV [Ferrimicrobium sp.]